MNINEIKQQYPLLQKVSDHYAFEMYKNIMSEQMITEFLYTVDPEITAKQIIKQAGYGVHINHSKNKITLTFDTLTKDYLDKVNKVMDKFGWYPSYIDNKNGGKYLTNIDHFIGKHEIVIEYEAKYDTQAKLDSKYVYHLTPDILYPKIKISGLTPKSQSKLSNHPERIYLLNPTDDDDMETIAITLWNSISNSKLKNSIGDYYLLRIDTSKLPNHKFFEDPNSISENEIHEAIRKAAIDLSIVPMMCGSSFKNKGVQTALDAVCRYLPSPIGPRMLRRIIPARVH